MDITHLSGSTPVFVDTDIGVDDAVAIAWLLRQPQIELVGFSTVFGNTTVESATRNLLMLCGAAGRQCPITRGAAAPLNPNLPRANTGALIHGPDGFWFAQMSNPQAATLDISSLPGDAPAAIIAAAQAKPKTIFIALGPLTNFALAIRQNPAALSGARLVALVGGTSGNRTPVAEFNAFTDPDALEAVLAGPMKVELVTTNAFEQLQIDPGDFIARLAATGDPLGKLLAAALGPYTQIQQSNNPRGRVNIPDAAAVIYALQPQLGSATSALVRVITDTGYARGQTIIATTPAQRLPLIADDAELSAMADQAFIPGFDLNVAMFQILSRQPDNATVVLELQGHAMAQLLEQGLTQ